MVADNPANPPKPRLTLRVGVTGKRQIAASELPRIRGELEKVLDVLVQALRDCWAVNTAVLAPERPVLRVVCGLAEGADLLVAELAAKRALMNSSAEVETKLAAILPFPREEFIKDFEFDPNLPEGQNQRTPQQIAAVVAHFDALLTEARKEAVLKLDDEALRATGLPAHRDLAYVGLRDLLVQHSDIIVAIFDETQERKPGGSADVAQLAAQESIPVIRISTVGEPVSLLRAAEPDDPDQRPRKETAPLDLDDPKSLADLVAATLSPPRAASPSADHASEHGARSGRKRLEDFLGENSRPATFAGIFKRCRTALLRWNRWVPPEVPDARAPHDQLLAAPYSSETRFHETLMKRSATADTFAIGYADSTRSSYIAIAACGAAAVLVGLLSVLFWGKIAGIVKVFLLGTEGFLLWWLAVQYYRPAHGGSWHERMVEYRVLAELLRHQRFVYAFGGAARAERTGDRWWRGPDAWLGWYVQATIRELGFPTTTVSAPYRRTALEAFRSEEVAKQLQYNDLDRSRNKTIDDALGRFIERAWATAVRVALAGAAIVLLLWLVKMCLPPESMAELLLDHVVKPVLTIVMAFLPALIAAVHGIRFQMEFGSASKRADATFKELTAIDGKLDKLLKPGVEPGRKASEAVVRGANDAMVADLSGWSTVYKHKAAELV